MTDHTASQQIEALSYEYRCLRQAKTTTIQWSGPFTQQDAAVISSSWGLYFFSGKCKSQHFSRIQYCGITEQYFSDRFRTHHKLYEITRDLEIWLGRIVDPRRVNRSLLLRAEHMLIYALQPPLNDRCKESEPPPTTIVSYWYDRSGGSQQNPHQNFPCVMSWDGTAWRKGNLEAWD